MPCLVPVVTVARTRSPVWKPLTCFAPLGLEQGKPSSSTLHFCLLPCPVAVICRGTRPSRWSTGGVLWPTQAASIQCAFGKLLLVRWYFVKPPDPHSRGKPSCLSRSRAPSGCY